MNNACPTLPVEEPVKAAEQTASSYRNILQVLTPEKELKSGDSKNNPSRLEFIDPERIEHICDIGEGSFSEVAKAKLDGRDVAIKILNPEAEIQFKTEVAILPMLRNPFVVKGLGITNAYGGSDCVIMEYMPGGSLRDLLTRYWKEHKAIDPVSGYKIIKAVANGLCYLEKAGVIHRDIKPENILLDNHGDAKLADFGSALKKYSQASTIRAGASGYRAPEVWTRWEYSTKSDVYSFATVTLEVFACSDPINYSLSPNACINGYREAIPEYFPLSIAKLIRHCWRTLPEERPTAKQILSYLERHPIKAKETSSISLNTDTPQVARFIVDDDDAQCVRFIYDDQEETPFVRFIYDDKEETQFVTSYAYSINNEAEAGLTSNCR